MRHVSSESPRRAGRFECRRVYTRAVDRPLAVPICSRYRADIELMSDKGFVADRKPRCWPWRKKHTRAHARTPTTVAQRTLMHKRACALALVMVPVSVAAHIHRYLAMAYIGMACIVVAPVSVPVRVPVPLHGYTVMGYIVMAYIVLAPAPVPVSVPLHGYTVMRYIGMAYIVMAPVPVSVPITASW